MNSEQTKWITRPSTLDYFDIEVRPPNKGDDAVLAHVSLRAHCSRRPKPLFVYSEPVTIYEGYEHVADVIHHFALVATQDKPTTKRDFIAGLMGQQKLPY